MARASATRTSFGHGGGLTDAQLRTIQEGTPQAKPQVETPWSGEAWARDDGVVLNLPIFHRCSMEFKRLLLREVRMFELESKGQETWLDPITDKICTLETLDEDRLPPLRMESIGQYLDPGDYICRGGDYDCKLVVVLNGTVEKLVGDAPAGGRVVVRTLRRGDCDGIAEFLSVGTEQRTCALRAGPAGAKVRFVTKDALKKVLSMPRLPEPGTVEEKVRPKYLDEVDEFEAEQATLPMRWPDEVAYFAELKLDRIDALPHRAANRLLQWRVTGEDSPLDLISLQQDLFKIDNALGTSLSGPLPEGIEERYYFNGQTVIRPGVTGDSLLLVLRGELVALIPVGCGGQCLPRQYWPDDVEEGYSWLGDGRDAPLPVDMVEPEPPPPPPVRPRTPPPADDETGRKHVVTEAERLVQQVALVTLVPPSQLKRALRLLRESGIDLSDQTSTDLRWSWEDPRALKVVHLLKRAKLLSQRGEEKAEELRLHQHPPRPPPPPKPQAVMQSGSVVGPLALLGVPVVLAGAVKARGAALVAVLHRSVLLEAVRMAPERVLFSPRGVPPKDWVRNLQEPPRGPERAREERPDHLGPAAGPPFRPPIESVVREPPAGGGTAFFRGDYAGMAGGDALVHALLNGVKGYHMLWELICDAPPRLLEALVQQFEPRWLLPNEVVVHDEEPGADFLFVVVHGELVVSLEGTEIERARQGDVQGAAQLLQLNEWTRTIVVDPKHRGEAMIQILRREKLVETLAGHPIPKGRLRDIEHSLRAAKGADWSLLQSIPAFGSSSAKPFLARVHKDADVRLWCPGDFLAEVGQALACMIVVLAGTLRSEQPQTLFHVELRRGDWCFQNNVLGNEAVCAHDVVAVTHSMVLVLHRHALLNAVAAFPECREAVLENETWRVASPELGGLRVFEGVPAPVLARLGREVTHKYFCKGSAILLPGTPLERDSMLFILRGEARVLLLGIEVRKLHTGDSIGVHRFLRLPQRPLPTYEIMATQASDVLLVRSPLLFEAMEDERFEDDMKPFRNAREVLAGGDILDAFGLKIDGKEAQFRPACVEESEIFHVCSPPFVRQLPELVEDLAFWPGERVYCQGDVGHFMYFVQAGRVRLEVLGREKHEVVEGGATLGDMACLKQVPCYTETAVAETHIWVRALHSKLLQRALASFPEEERRVMGKASKNNAGVFGDE